MSPDSQWIEVLLSECEAVGVAKLPQYLPRGLMPPPLDEELVQKEEPLGGETVTLNTIRSVSLHNGLDVLEGLWLQGGIKATNLGRGERACQLR